MKIYIVLEYIWLDLEQSEQDKQVIGAFSTRPDAEKCVDDCRWVYREIIEQELKLPDEIEKGAKAIDEYGQKLAEFLLGK